MKKSSRNWSTEEDKMLQQTIMQNNGTRKLKWQQVAEIMHERIANCQKTGKQCRERWHNHLAPELNNSGEWTQQQNQILFQYHSELGNKWAKIATYLKGRTDNCVKNHFYSTLRRGMRKVNNFIHEHRRKKSSIKQFKSDVLTKILIVADGDPQQKLNAKNNAQQLSKNIKKLLIQVSLEQDEDNYDQIVLDKIIELIMQFNKNCKKRKGKKKGPPTDKAAQISKDEQNQQQDQLSEQEGESVKVESVQVKRNENQKNPPSKIFIKDLKQKQNTRQKQNNQKPVKKQQKKEQIQSKFDFKSQFTKYSNDAHKNGNQKDEVKITQQNVPVQNQIKQQIQKNGGKKISRLNSMQSFTSEANAFAGSFYLANFNNGSDEVVDKLFKSSGFGLNFPAPQPTNPNAKSIFAQSGASIKRNQAFFHLSGMSAGDERNSFFNLTNQRGVIQPDNLLNSKQLNRSQLEALKIKNQCSSPIPIAFPGSTFVSQNNSFSKNFQNFQNFQGFQNFQIQNIQGLQGIQQQNVVKQEGFSIHKK